MGFPGLSFCILPEPRFRTTLPWFGLIFKVLRCPKPLLNHKKNVPKIKDPKKSLPEDIFLLLSRISPLVNVDLLIKNKKNQILLTWRQKGQVYPEGWHIPGGIIRYKEKFTNRIKEVANQ